MDKTTENNPIFLEYKTVKPIAKRSSDLSEKARKVSGAMTTLEDLQKAAESPERLSSASLLREVIDANLKQVGSQKTLRGYEADLEHFLEYIETVRNTDAYSAQRKDIHLFLNHMADKGGAKPAESRVFCSWCRDHGYPDGPSGQGWSPSSIKGALSAIRFLYEHFLRDDDLPDRDPSLGVAAPKVVIEPQWSPSRDEVKKLLAFRGTPRGRLLAHWMFYAPSRRRPFSDARWRDIDLEQGTWTLIGKGQKVDSFDLPPVLVREFKAYRRWILKEAEKNPDIAAALADEETAFVLLTRRGNQIHGQQLAKELKRHALNAGVGVVKIPKTREYPYGKTSKLSPHALRRAWARLALNHPRKPVPIDVVSAVLHHEDIDTTRRHYAPTKPERARAATRDFKL